MKSTQRKEKEKKRGEEESHLDESFEEDLLGCEGYFRLQKEILDRWDRVRGPEEREHPDVIT